MMLRIHWRRLRSKFPWLQMVQTWRFWLLVAFTCVFLTYILIAFRPGPVTYFQQEIKEIKLGNLDFDFQTGLFFLGDKNNVYLRGSIPDAQQLSGTPNHCGQYNVSKYLCASWYQKVNLEVENTLDEHASCQVLTWTPLFDDYKPHTCFSMADFNWYGGSLMSKQSWPLNKAEVNLQPYKTHDLESYTGETTVIGNILDWFFISSSGVAVIIDNKLPLHVSINQSGNKLLCVHSMSLKKPVLKYTLCRAASMRKIQRYVIDKYIHLPQSLPNDVYFTDPMWSTYPLLKDRLNQDVLHTYFLNVEENQFERNLLDIHDIALTVFRTNPFPKSKFLNSHQLLMYARDAKFDTFLPVSPFVSVTDIKKLDLIKDNKRRPAVAKFGGEDVCIVNLLDEQSLDIYIDEIKTQSQEFGANGFHLVGGESDFLNVGNTDEGSVDLEQISSRLIDGISIKLKLPVLSTFASRNQKNVPVIKLTSPSSSWDEVGGLQSVIPSVLTLGLIGYPFVIPNVVGGAGNMKAVNSSYSERMKPDRELYVRWMGMAAYMPCMMFSFTPWSYDEEVVKIARQFVRQHKDVVAPLVIKAAREFEITGSPVIRPLWWLDPSDKTTQTVDSQYLIGDGLLVAPVLHQGHTSRDIYIPQGRWLDNINGVEVESSRWLRDFPVPLDKVATFSRIKS